MKLLVVTKKSVPWLQVLSFMCTVSVGLEHDRSSLSECEHWYPSLLLHSNRTHSTVGNIIFLVKGLGLP